MATGTDVDVDVDLTLSADDAPPCILDWCPAEAVMEGVHTSPCGCRVVFCLAHYEQHKPYYKPGVGTYCTLCPEGPSGVFLRWERL